MGFGRVLHDRAGNRGARRLSGPERRGVPVRRRQRIGHGRGGKSRPRRGADRRIIRTECHVERLAPVVRPPELRCEFMGARQSIGRGNAAL